MVHGFSTRALGSMSAWEARAGLIRALGLEAGLSVVGAVHGARVARVDAARGVVEATDGLVTDRPGVALCCSFADCHPVILFDPGRTALALVHAGWRGTEAGIAGVAVATLEREYGCAPGDLRAAIGPGICGACYEVGPEVGDRFQPAFVSPGPGDRQHLDLAAANHAQLLAAGLPAARIETLDVCTSESSDLFSHRRQPDGSRFAGVAAIVRPR